MNKIGTSEVSCYARRWRGCLGTLLFSAAPAACLLLASCSALQVWQRLSPDRNFDFVGNWGFGSCSRKGTAVGRDEALRRCPEVRMMRLRRRNARAVSSVQFGVVGLQLLNRAIGFFDFFLFVNNNLWTCAGFLGWSTPTVPPCWLRHCFLPLTKQSLLIPPTRPAHRESEEGTKPMPVMGQLIRPKKSTGLRPK